jgi:RNA-directed DNA polymerase
MFRRTITGTPQGGIISPLLANIALHGMEEALNVKYQKINNRNSFYYRNVSKYLVVRYADDLLYYVKQKKMHRMFINYLKIIYIKED